MGFFRLFFGHDALPAVWAGIVLFEPCTNALAMEPVFTW